MIYFLVALALFGIEFWYLGLAGRYQIVDKPNIRSSHAHITKRGGGIVIPLAMLVYLVTSGFSLPIFHFGLFALAAISFADDIREQSALLRFSLQFVCVGLLLWQSGIFHQSFMLGLLSLFALVGALNAFNFMDGINGISVGYGAVGLATLWYLNASVPFIDPAFFIYLAIGMAVFAFFNFRTKALCFAGDVGSVSLALCLLFPTMVLIRFTQQPLFVMFFAVYGVDTLLTIFHRLLKQENIFKAHRQHLYQYLANEQKISHLSVTGIYMAIQLLINIGFVYLYFYQGEAMLTVYSLSVLGVLSAAHTWLKRNIIRQKVVLRSLSREEMESNLVSKTDASAHQ